MNALGLAALVLLPLIAIFGGIEYRREVLAAARWLRAAAAKLPPFMPHCGTHRDPARAVWASARRTAPGLETPVPAGTVPDAAGARPGNAASGTAIPSRLLSTGELAMIHPRAHRPVNGRLLGDQPRAYGQVPVARVLADEDLAAERQAARAAGVWARRTGRVRPAPYALLEQVRTGLLAITTATAVYPCCDHCEDCDEIHGKPCAEPGCPGAEPIRGDL